MTVERSHAAQFAEHLIRTKGPMPLNAIYAAFVNLGNEIPGETIQERRIAFVDLLNADEKLELDELGSSWRLAAAQPAPSDSPPQA